MVVGQILTRGMPRGRKRQRERERERGVDGAFPRFSCIRFNIFSEAPDNPLSSRCHPIRDGSLRIPPTLAEACPPQGLFYSTVYSSLAVRALVDAPFDRFILFYKELLEAADE